MGNLHKGHLALVQTAASHADQVMVSIFVNPTQFGPDEDFSSYPRTFEADFAKLAKLPVDAIFAPSEVVLYPEGASSPVFVDVPELGDILCGAFRPGHFRGVATVITKLFNLVRPDFAVFGEKDYQQLLVIRRLTRALLYRVRIVGTPTVRESDGLALSSRNQYLTPAQRRVAPQLHMALREAAESLASGEAISDIERQELAKLEAAGFRPDYFAIRDAKSLASPEEGSEKVILAAAWLGKARLIDNIKG